MFILDYIIFVIDQWDEKKRKELENQNSEQLNFLIKEQSLTVFWEQSFMH